MLEYAAKKMFKNWKKAIIPDNGALSGMQFFIALYS